MIARSLTDGDGHRPDYFDPVPLDEANRRRWQREGMIALLELLARTSETNPPPPIPWTVLTVGALLGRAENAGQVEAWAASMAAPVIQVPVSPDTIGHRCDTVWRSVRVTVTTD